MGILAKGKEKKPLNPEEVLELAKEDGVELTDEELESVNGGWGDEPVPLPKCDIYTTPPMV